MRWLFCFLIFQFSLFAKAGSGLGSEKREKAFTLCLENDLFATTSDRDYTGGFSLNLTGEGVEDFILFFDRPLKHLDELFGVPARRDSPRNLVNFELGSSVFTPEDTGVSQPIPGERPYANLVYISSGFQTVHEDSKTVWRSGLTFGLMGMEFGHDIQSRVHKTLGNETAKGWNNQISDGGEPTFLYQISRDTLHRSIRGKFQLFSSAASSLGYLTEAGAGVGIRLGRLAKPWWKFSSNPGAIGPGTDVAFLNFNSENSFYFTMGAQFSLRFYNAFLQGQFRDSAVTYSWNETRFLVGEVYVGLVKQFGRGLMLSYVLRGRSSELKVGKADRAYTWGGLIFSYAY